MEASGVMKQDLPPLEKLLLKEIPGTLQTREGRGIAQKNQNQISHQLSTSSPTPWQGTPETPRTGLLGRDQEHRGDAST